MELRTYTGDVDSNHKEIIVVSIIMFNKEEVPKTAYLDLYNRHNELRSRILETEVGPKESVFLDNKIIVADGDVLKPFGCTFTIGVNEHDL